MKNRPLGCLTVNGLIAAVLVALSTALFGLVRGGALFSPGALNAQAGEALGGVSSHAEITACAACHAAPWASDRMTERCLACHTAIHDQITTQTGLHSAMITSAATTCQECHTEHHGMAAALTIMAPADFPHDATGFSLRSHMEDSQDPLVCEDCHLTFGSFNRAVCEQCHTREDPQFLAGHSLSFGTECLNCHDGIDTYGRGYDHSAAEFLLTGMHQETACSGCHQNQGTLDAIRQMPHDCVTCHLQDDPHGGAFGDQCQVCHSPASWNETSFDHATVGFDLVGKHAGLECSACHAVHEFTPISTDCYSCHADDDAHDGTFGTSCERCHTPAGWDQVTFDHNILDFPLTGAHLDVACLDCHAGGFENTPSECAACHTEPDFHAGLLGTDCATCHTTTAWLPASFDGPHSFPLDHGGGATCQTCHPATLSGYTCYGCHEHNPADIEAEHLDEGISNFGNCVSCHPNGLKDEAEGGGDDD